MAGCLVWLEVASAATYSWTQVTRWREDVTTTATTRKIYPETIFPTKGYDSRPHQQLRSMFPGAISGDGNNTLTSDNLWDQVMASPQVLGNSTTLTRARDLVEDYQINFLTPLTWCGILSLRFTAMIPRATSVRLPTPVF